MPTAVQELSWAMDWSTQHGPSSMVVSVFLDIACDSQPPHKPTSQEDLTALWVIVKPQKSNRSTCTAPH